MHDHHHQAPAAVPDRPVPNHWHEVHWQELLKFKMHYGRPYVLVRWSGIQVHVDSESDAVGDTWPVTNGPFGLKGRTEETDKHYNLTGVCLSDYLACA